MIDSRTQAPGLPGMTGATLEEFKELLQAAGMSDCAARVGTWAVTSILAVAIRRHEWNAALADWFQRWGKEQLP